MTFCLGIITHEGFVVASDCRTNAGADQANVTRKMHSFVDPARRVFVLLTSGNLSIAQSVITLLRQEFNEGLGLASSPSMYDAARVVGEQIRRVANMDAASLKRDNLGFDIRVILAGQVVGEAPALYMVYPQGNPLRATKDTCYLLTGESKYGKPILDRGITFRGTTVAEAAKYALLSMDATMRSNVTVGPPIDLAIYREDDFGITMQRRFHENEPDLVKIHRSWERSLRKAVGQLPEVTFGDSAPHFYTRKPNNGAA